jgi:hypothetical protein
MEQMLVVRRGENLVHRKFNITRGIEWEVHGSHGYGAHLARLPNCDSHGTSLLTLRLPCNYPQVRDLKVGKIVERSEGTGERC